MMDINEVYQGEAIELLKELPEGLTPIMVTDPPFNIGYHYSGYSDRMRDEEYYSMLENAIAAVAGRAVIVHYPEALHKLSMRIGQAPEKVLSWVYNSNTRRQHRDIAYYGIKPNMAQVIQPYKNPTDKRIRERIARGIEGGALYDWFNVNQVKNVSAVKKKHPCQMPLQVMMNAVGVIPGKGKVLIVDPFCGTGTTLVAAAKLGYAYVGFDINPEYVEIARERLKTEGGSGDYKQLSLF